MEEYYQISINITSYLVTWNLKYSVMLANVNPIFANIRTWEIHTPFSKNARVIEFPTKGHSLGPLLRRSLAQILQIHISQGKTTKTALR